MSTRELERDAVERPTVNPWRQRPTGDQVRYATALCRSELPYADRVVTIESFPALDRPAMSALIDTLVEVREQRMARLRRACRRRRR
jgi:hypothetical protein